MASQNNAEFTPEYSYAAKVFSKAQENGFTEDPVEIKKEVKKSKRVHFKPVFVFQSTQEFPIGQPHSNSQLIKRTPLIKNRPPVYQLYENGEQTVIFETTRTLGRLATESMKPEILPPEQITQAVEKLERIEQELAT